jgi:hypothetical protein
MVDSSGIGIPGGSMSHTDKPALTNAPQNEAAGGRAGGGSCSVSLLQIPMEHV